MERSADRSAESSDHDSDDFSQCSGLSESTPLTPSHFSRRSSASTDLPSASPQREVEKRLVRKEKELKKKDRELKVPAPLLLPPAFFRPYVSRHAKKR